jgi:tetratricopeptide (TPR) repeat protein
MLGIGGDQEAAITQYRDAARAYRRHERHRDAARADAEVGQHVMRLGRFEEARGLLENALTVLGGQHDTDTVRATASLAELHTFAGNAEEAHRLWTAALALAQASDLPDREVARLFIGRGISHGLVNQRAESSAYLHEAIRLAEVAHDPATVGGALLNLTDALVVNDPAAAAEAGRAAVTHCRRVGDHYRLQAAAGNLLQALLYLGAWGEARQIYSTGVTHDDLGGDIVFDCPALLLHVLSGDETEVSRTLNRIERFDDSEDPQARAGLALSIAVSAAHRDRAREAFAQSMRAISIAEPYGLSHDTSRWAWPIAADAALALGDHVEVMHLLDTLDRHPPGHIPPVLRAERLRIRARLLATSNDPDTGSAFDAAVRAFRDFGSPHHLAVALLDHAEYLARTGDPTTARQQVDEAGEIAGRLSAQPLVDRVTNWRAQKAVIAQQYQ